MKTFRIFLMILIVIGLILLATQKIWVSKLVDKILSHENNAIVVPITPAPTFPKVSVTQPPTNPITQQQAIDIVVTQRKIDLTTQNIQATFKNNNWYINTWPKPLLKCPHCQINVNGGDEHFIVDGKTGAIISTTLGQ